MSVVTFRTKHDVFSHRFLAPFAAEVTLIQSQYPLNLLSFASRSEDVRVTPGKNSKDNVFMHAGISLAVALLSASE
jgi:hypothetical protein